jgi:O-antigen/teichoic acid export membrane protein
VEEGDALRSHLSNAAYGILDYAAYPIGMLVVAPVVLRNLGLEQYGVWALATAAASTGGIIASGFGDANIQHVATQRGAGNEGALVVTVRSMMGINLLLGIVLSAIGWTIAPFAAAHMALGHAQLQRSCLWSLRIASLLIAMRAVESVCISTQRAFERYGAAVRVSIAVRLLALVASAGLAFLFHSVIAMVVATGCLTLAGLWLQLVPLKRLLSATSLMPGFDREAIQSLFGFGAFSWLQAVAGVVFSQIDRLLLGVFLGAGVVASYALSAQLALPIFGFTASGLHFLFPYLSHRLSSPNSTSIKRPLFVSLACNALFVGLSTTCLLVVGDRILRVWAGAAIAQGSTPILSILIWSSALLGLNVTATYTLLALGRVQIVTWFNLAGGVVMLLLILLLTPRMGVRGVAIARLSYTLFPLLLYIPLIRQLLSKPSARKSVPSLEEFPGPLEVTS